MLKTVWNSSSQLIFILVILGLSFSDLCSTSVCLSGSDKGSGLEEYLQVLEELRLHIEGVAILSDSDLEGNHDVLVANLDVLASDHEAIMRSFDLIELFEDVVGPLFTTSNTRSGFNKQYSSDGRNLHRNLILIYQGLIDHSYNSELLKDSMDVLNGKYFRSSEYFPGYVEAPQNPDSSIFTKIRCSYMLAKGSQPWREIGNDNVIRPTGCYLAPGSIAKITVPDSMVGKGIKIRVGAHFWDLENKNQYKRMDRVSILYDVNEPMTEIAHPLGGGIYIEIPLGIDLGIQEIELKNVVRAPFYSKKTFHQTSLSEWQDTERHHPAPWADFESDKFMMQVPTSWIYQFDDPQTLMEDWDKSMDAVSDLLGRPRIVDRHKNYLQFDVIIRGSAYHPGYPMSNTPYDPNASTDGTPNHNILRGPQYGQDIHFHELGHEVAITKFAGETEAIVNFLYVPVLNRCFGYSLDEAFQSSFGPSYNYFSTKDNSTRTRLVANSFREGIPRNTCNCTQNEVRYQHRGYAHYVDIAELYGWEALEKFWQSESDAADMGNPFPVNNQEQDDRIFRMSKAAGVDLRPLFHFWGIHPQDQNALAQRMQENGLELPMLIKQKLHKYRDLIPVDYDEFVEFGNELYPDFLNYSGSQFDFGAGWYKVTAEMYDEAMAEQIQQALSDIIVLYYGTDCFELVAFEELELNLMDSYCVSDEAVILPSVTENNIEGSWFPQELIRTEPGQFEYTFVPDPGSCSLDSIVQIGTYERELDILGEVQFCFGGSTLLMIEDDDFEVFSWMLNGQEIGDADSVVVMQSGDLNVTAFDSEACRAEETLSIQESPAIDIYITVVDPLCYDDAGQAFFEASNEDDEYSYSMNGNSLFPGVYTVQVMDSLGCTADFEFEINQVDPLIIELIDNEIIVHGGTQPYEIVLDTVGNVQTVQVTDSNDCEASTEFILSGIQELFDRQVELYPNPTWASVHVESGESKITSLKIFTPGGQLVKTYFPGERDLDLGDLNEGLYLLQLGIGNGIHVNKKLVLIR